MKKYAIRIMLSADDWIYMTVDTGNCFDLVPMLFDTQDEAEEAAKIWHKQGRKPITEVVEYDGELYDIQE